MNFTVNENTYVTVEEADEYIESTRRIEDALRVHWSVLTDDEKKSYLVRSVREMETLPFVGRKYTVDQKLAFPRYKRGMAPYYGMGRFYCNDDFEVPEDVKFAQIENALGIINEEYKESRSTEWLTSLGLISVAQPLSVEERELTSKKAFKLLGRHLGALRA